MRIVTLTDNNGRVYTLVPVARSENYILVQAGETTGIYERSQDTPKPTSKVEKLKELQRRFSTNLDYGAQWADLVKILNVLIEDEE